MKFFIALKLLLLIIWEKYITRIYEFFKAHKHSTIFRNLLWFSVWIFSIYLKFYNNSFIDNMATENQSVAKVILVIPIIWGLSMLLSIISIYSFTKHKFENEDNPNIGRIFQAIGIISAVVMCGFYFTTL